VTVEKARSAGAIAESESDASLDAAEQGQLEPTNGTDELQLRVWCRFHMLSDEACDLAQARAMPPLSFAQFETLVETLAPRSHAPLSDRPRANALMWALLTGAPGGTNAELALPRFLDFFKRAVVDAAAGPYPLDAASLLSDFSGVRPPGGENASKEVK
jgi:hypothetical protein